MSKRFSLILLTLLGFSCKQPGIVKFQVPYESSITVPSSTGANLPLNLFSPEVSTTNAAEFELNDTRVDLLTSLILNKLELTISAPNNANFDFLKSITIFINAQDLPEVEIARLQDIPDSGSKTINIPSTKVELKEYIKKGKFTLKANTVTDRFISQDIQIKVNTLFDAEATVIKSR